MVCPTPALQSSPTASQKGFPLPGIWRCLRSLLSWEGALLAVTAQQSLNRLVPLAVQALLSCPWPRLWVKIKHRQGRSVVGGEGRDL